MAPEEEMAQQVTGQELSDEAIEAVRRRRFEERIARVLAVMRQERVDWRGIAYLTPDGRVAVRVVPVEVREP